ncbi:hypothetical protein F1559_001785 [Cyanidiococcus yangmingshanensis]|uniref:Uncharacterized protein n=1 Tax=Cyanidiococcus yangmingshanensis TaxID=2690220 RepID=A0A7J7IMM8_9RHOD|nr:hypothetical protein F1559_001785 [Cyanidiococcus yangmingshanensis]
MDEQALGIAYAHWIGQKLLGLEQDKTALELEHTSATKDHSSEDQDEQRMRRLASVSETAMAASAAQCFRLGAETLETHLVALIRRKTLLPIRDASLVPAKSETGRKRARGSRSNAATASMVPDSRPLESGMVETLQRMRSAYLVTCLTYLVSWQATSASAWRWMWTSILTDAWRLRLYTRSDADDPVLSKHLSGLLHRLIPLAIERGLRPVLFTRITTEPFHTPETLSRCFLDERARSSAVDAFRIALVATLATHRDSERLWQMLLDLCAETGQVVQWSPALERTMTNTVSTRWTRTQCWSMFQRLVYAFHQACAFALPRRGDNADIQGWVSQPIQAETSLDERYSPSKAVWSLLPLLVACAESTTRTTMPLPNLNDASFHEAFRACWQWSRREQPAQMPDLARVALALLQLHLATSTTPCNEFKTLVELCEDWQPETDTTNGLLLEYRQRTLGDRYETLRTIWSRRRSRVIPELRWRTLEWAQAALRVAMVTKEATLVHAVFEMVPEHPEIVRWLCKDVDIWDIRTDSDSCATDQRHTTNGMEHCRAFDSFLVSMDVKLLVRPTCLRLLTAIPRLPDGDVLASTLDLLFSRLFEAFAYQSLAPDILTRLCWSVVHLRRLDGTRAGRSASVSVHGSSRSSASSLSNKSSALDSARSNKVAVSCRAFSGYLVDVAS